MRCFRPALRARTPIIEALESRQLLSATPQLLADINTQASGIPREFIEFSGRLYYSASDPEHGQELWSSDGTSEGTHLVKDINQGIQNSGPQDFVVFNGSLYFTALTASTGFRLWRTDGTEAGTQMVHTVGVSSADKLVEFNGSVYFIGIAGTSGPDLWKSDGTSAGTVLIKDLGVASSGDASELTVVGNKLFLTTNSTQGSKLWQSDGTANGTSAVKDFGLDGLSSTDALLTNLNDTLYFRASDNGATDALWKSDGTAVGTVKLAVGEPGFLSDANSLTVIGDRLYFAANSGATGNELWSSDGTAAGTQLVADLAPGAGSFAPRNLFAIDDTLFFRGMPNAKGELWSLSTATLSTQRLATLEKNDLPLELVAMTEFQGELYLTAFSDVLGADLWRSDGTPLGTFPWRAQIAPAGTLQSFEMGTAAGRMFFTANVGGTGMELWSTDGTFGGTRLMFDGAIPSSEPSTPQNFVTAGDFVYFTANDGTGRHLFSSPGPSGPVNRLTTSAYEVQSTDVEQLVPVGNDLYFVARDIHGRRYLGVTSGTPQTTHSLEWPFADEQVEIEGLTQFASGVMFVAHDAALGVLVCKADVNGIEVVATLDPVWTLAETVEAVVSQGVYYFVAAGTQNELWRSDGTQAGTWRVRDAVPNLGLNPYQLTATDAAFYFISQDDSPALWRTDATQQGTLQFTGVPVPDKLIAAGDNLYFRPQAAPPGPGGSASLWVSDGTMAGTKFLTHYNDAIGAPYRPRPVAAALGSDLYFYGVTPTSTFALMKTDGTTEGTTVVINSLLGIPNSYDIVSLGDRLYLNTGLLLLESDGTSAGTRALIIPDPFPPFFSDRLAISLTRLGSTLYLAYADPNFQAGIEPHTLTDVPATIVGRHLYYNNSKFDENTPSAFPPLDDLAIATDKTPYFAGTGTATFESISSYSRGINGVMVDIAGRIPDGLLGTLSANDFQFRRGTGDDPTSWTMAPAPQSFWTQEKTDENGDFTRVYFTWADGAIKNTWLEVTVLANGRTGLFEPDIFYFGSRVGDTGSGSPTAAVTSAADELAARFAPGVNQPITSLLDFDRNGVVSAGDALIARNNGGILLKLNLPGENPPAAAPVVNLAITSVDDDLADIAAQSLVEPLVTRALAEESARTSPSRAELLACAAQAWSEWLSVEDEDKLIGTQVKTARSRR